MILFFDCVVWLCGLTVWFGCVVWYLVAVADGWLSGGGREEALYERVGGGGYLYDAWGSTKDHKMRDG